MSKPNLLKLIGIILVLGLISIVLIVIFSTDRVLTVEEVSPNTRYEYSPTQEISISFNNLSDTAKDDIAFITNPYIDTAYYWEEDNLIIKPELFEPGKIYAARVYLGKNILQEFTFTIKQIDQLDKDEKKSYQVALLNKTTEEVDQLIEQKPWIADLPILLDEFTIIYDSENDVIRVRINNSQDLSTAEIADIRESAAKKLSSINVDPDQKIVFIDD